MHPCRLVRDQWVARLKHFSSSIRYVNGREKDMFKDPVCGMMVDEKTAQHKSNIEGKTVFLCSAGCKTQFESNPKKYGY
jgi:YHS domain-containing protein